MKLALSIMTFLMSGTLLAGGTDVGNSGDSTFQVASAKNLCLQGLETVLFSCSVVHNNKLKTVSVCQENTANNVHYRFGQQLDEVELKLSLFNTLSGDEAQAAERNNPTSGEVLSVKFQSGAYTYEVWSQSGDHGPDSAGLNILKNGEYISNMNCVEETKSKGFDLDSLGSSFPFSDGLNQ